MKFKIIETGIVVEIRIVNDDTGIDCFWGLEICFPHDHPDRDEDGNIVCSQADYDDLKNYWKDEVKTYLDGANPNWYESDNMGYIVDSDPLTIYTD